MSVARNIYADMPEKTKVTKAVAQFVERVGSSDLPEDAVLIATRCTFDGLGLYVAGSDHHMVQILADEAG